jgi:ubiquinone biosynthesis protein UbiJ
MVDHVLRGIATSDFADVLFRAAAFARVVATGRATLDGSLEDAARMQTLADQLESAAHQELAHQLG